MRAMEQSKPWPGKLLPPLITITGLKRSGKTAVVEAIVSELCSLGHEVGTIKTMRHHRVSLGAEETDTRRHAEAGAAVVVALHADGTVCFEKGASPATRLDVSRFFPGSVDILISEGLLDPAEARNVVLCVRNPLDLEETLRVRRISRDSIVAISGTGASAWRDPAFPAYDVMVPEQRKALVEMLLKRVVGNQ